MASKHNTSMAADECPSDRTVHVSVAHDIGVAAATVVLERETVTS